MHTSLTTAVYVLLVVSLGLVVGFKGQSSTIADHDIRAAISQRLAMDGRIEPKAINVKVDNGRAILSGTVETLTEKALAENLVASTYGVKAVDNQLIVKPAPTKDTAVQRAVKEAIKTTPALQKSDIQVAVSDGVVTLKGAVEKPSQSAAAELAALHLLVQLLADGVLHVLLLRLADEAGRVVACDGLLFHGLVGALQLAGNAVGVDAQGEVDAVGEDVVLEAEVRVEHVAPAAPSPLDLLDRAELALLEDVLRELVQEFLVRLLRRLADDREPAERDRARGEAHAW